MNLNELPYISGKLSRQLFRFRIVIFILLLLSLYGYMTLRVQSLANVQPNQEVIAAKAPPARPNVDKATLAKIKQLQDNSVNVRSLFSQARQNPFQE